MTLREEASRIAYGIVGPVPYEVKVTECRDGRHVMPAWRVYVRLAGTKRGRHVATIIRPDIGANS